MLDYILIGMVLDEELTGYDIKKDIEYGIGNFYKVSYGNLYPTLKKLTEKGVLTMRHNAQGGREKIYYLATEQGKEDFLKWLSSPLDSKSSLDNLMVKVFFYDALDADVCRERLRECELYLQQALMTLKNAEREISELDDDKYYYSKSTMYFGIRSIMVSIDWVKHIMDRKSLTEFITEKGE